MSACVQKCSTDTARALPVLLPDKPKAQLALMTPAMFRTLLCHQFLYSALGLMHDASATHCWSAEVQCSNLGKAGLSSSACRGAQLGVKLPHPDMPPCVPHHHMLMLGITAHAVDAVQPVHCCPDGAHQRWRAAHPPHTHATITCTDSSSITVVLAKLNSCKVATR